MRRKMYRYQVTCTIGVANEMCRYEGSRIVEQEIVKEYRRKDGTLADEYKTWTVFRFTIETECCVIARWRSFGVEPVINSTQDY